MGEYLLTNGKVITPYKVLPQGEVRVSGQVITGVGSESTGTDLQDLQIIDAQGGYIAPGLIDLHIHGSRGYSVMEASIQSLRALGQYLARTGTVAYLPTTMTAGIEEISLVAQVFAKAEKETFPDSAQVLGLHLEGPYINPRRQGAQSGLGARPFNLRELEELQELAQGRIKRITLAPEILPDYSLLEKVIELGIAPSIGHSDASYEQVLRFVEAGGREVSHLYNGMSGLDHHNPGVAAAALDRRELRVEVIADGVHIHPALLRITLQAKGPNQVFLITDAHPGAGLPMGTYPELGVEVQEDAVYLQNGVLAGSKISLLDAVGYLFQVVGVPLETAFRMASLIPAQIMGIDDRQGSLQPGKEADLLVLDQNFNLKHLLLKGRKLF